MPLCNMRDLLNNADKGGYAVPALSVANLECVMGAVAAAEELRAPIILQVAEVRLKHTPLSLIGPMMIAAAKNASVPIAVHLDHGSTLECVQQALDTGFTSVMYDGSHLPIEENLANVRKVIEMASKTGAAVETDVVVWAAARMAASPKPSWLPWTTALPWMLPAWMRWRWASATPMVSTRQPLCCATTLWSSCRAR